MIIMIFNLFFYTFIKNFFLFLIDFKKKVEKNF